MTEETTTPVPTVEEILDLAKEAVAAWCLQTIVADNRKPGSRLEDDDMIALMDALVAYDPTFMKGRDEEPAKEDAA